MKPAQGQGGLRERQLEQLLVSCCDCCLLSELHPHTALSIVLQVHTAQGSVSGSKLAHIVSVYCATGPHLQLLPTLCVALCLAVVDAGLPLSSPFSSLSTAFPSPDAGPLTDPTLAQEQVSHPRFQLHV